MGVICADPDQGRGHLAGIQNYDDTDFVYKVSTASPTSGAPWAGKTSKRRKATMAGNASRSSIAD